MKSNSRLGGFTIIEACIAICALVLLFALIFHACKKHGEKAKPTVLDFQKKSEKKVPSEPVRSIGR